MPGAGHIVHMPTHIYARVGRYKDATEANQHAIHADQSFIRDQNRLLRFEKVWAGADVQLAAPVS